MFKKKTCKKCGTGIRDKYNFCPYCGTQLAGTGEDFGMLGKNDFFNENNFGQLRLPAGLNMLFNSSVKNLEKQFKEIERRAAKSETDKSSPEKKGNISISISIGNKTPLVKVNAPLSENPKKEIRIASFEDLSPEQLKKFSKLPKEEPKTNIRRLSNKVLYEIDIPGVKSSKDISILNLEKGVELKALSEKKAYLKSIPITLPITNYKLSKGKLVLEMDARGN